MLCSEQKTDISHRGIRSVTVMLATGGRESIKEQTRQVHN